MTEESPIPEKTIERMVQRVEPEWQLREAAPVEGGHADTYRVEIETAASIRTCYLKTTADGDDRSVPADARITAVLEKHTTIPVPEIRGVVDGHDELPSPYLLMYSMPGRNVSYEQVGWFPDRVLRTVAHQTGAYLGELHRIDAVDTFGYVAYDRSKRLAGGRPDGTVGELAVVDGLDSWQEYLGRVVEHELDRHASSQFSGLTSRLRTWCDERIERLSGSFSPVLGRNDHGLHNLLVEPDTGEITAMLDWAYTLAVPPAYDFQFGAYIFSGAFLSGIDDVPDRCELVRDAMMTGYRSTAPELVDAISIHYPLYEMLAMIRIMNDFELLTPKLPDGTVGAATDGLREDAESMLESSG